MKQRLTITVIFLASLVTISTPVFAHHGNSAYDYKNPVTISGDITDFEWTNPHCQIYLDVKDAKGEVVNWGVETNSPGILARAGWTKRTVKPGDHVSIKLLPAKSGAPVGFLVEMTLPNGQVMTTKEKS
jgi:hypothetical protein